MTSDTKKISDFNVLESKENVGNPINEYSTIKYRYVVISLILVISGIFLLLSIPSIEQRSYKFLFLIVSLVLLISGFITPLKAKKITKSNAAVL